MDAATAALVAFNSQKKRASLHVKVRELCTLCAEEVFKCFLDRILIDLTQITNCVETCLCYWFYS